MELLPIGAFPGVYIIYCNNKKYIGSSNNINKRITDHKRELRNNEHHSYLLQKEYNKFPNITAFCIKKCLNNEVLFEEEQKFLDTENPELNVSNIAQNNVPTKEYANLKQGGERNHRAIITLSNAIEIVNERLKGSTLKSISELLNINYAIVVSICSANNWAMELEKAIPKEYAKMIETRKSLGITNRSSHKPSNRLFTDESLLDVLLSLLDDKTLQSIADKYDTSKAVISSIKRYKTYREDIKRLLTEAQFNDFISRIK